MRKWTLLALLALVAACAPQQTQQAPSVGFAAPPQQLLQALAELGPRINPGAGYNNYKLTGQTPSSVSFTAELSVGTGFSFLAQDSRLDVVCRVIPAQGRTDVGFVSCTPEGRAQQFYNALGTRYRQL